MELSVIICTYNPKKEHLTRTLEGLQKQSLSQSRWELLIIDNASDKPVSEYYNLDWHINGRIISEPDLGLTNARVRGIREARADLLVYVDDDLILRDDYLNEALKISEEYNWIGIWGGNLIGEFESPPPDIIMPYIEMLAVRNVEGTRWSNLRLWETTPSGAGMVVRKDVANKYAEETKNSELKKFLSRKGKSLSSGGEIDIAHTAIELGYGCGLFPNLSGTHLLPSERLDENYLIRLQEGIYFSSMIISGIRDKEPKKPLEMKFRMLRKIYHFLLGDRFKFRMTEAQIRGEKRAQKFLEAIEKKDSEALWKLRSLRL